MTSLTDQLIHTVNYSDELETKSIKMGVWTITTTQTIEKDWHFYSKSWHRSHGPKKIVTERSIVFCRKHGKGKLKKTMILDSWAGNFISKAVIHFDLAPKSPKLPLSIRLNKAYDAKLIEKRHGYSIYDRTLLNSHVDYVIVASNKTVYHDTDKEKLLVGVHKKIRERARKLKGLVNYNKCKKLGFCEAGIKEFCSLFNLDLSSSYTLSEIENEVRKNIDLATPFINELKTLANAFNYKVLEFK